MRRGLDLGGGRAGHADPRALQQEGAPRCRRRCRDVPPTTSTWRPGEHLARKRFGRIHAAPAAVHRGPHLRRARDRLDRAVALGRERRRHGRRSARRRADRRRRRGGPAARRRRCRRRRWHRPACRDAARRGTAASASATSAPWAPSFSATVFAPEPKAVVGQRIGIVESADRADVLEAGQADVGAARSARASPRARARSATASGAGWCRTRPARRLAFAISIAAKQVSQALSEIAAEMPERCSTFAAAMRSRGRSCGRIRLAAEPLAQEAEVVAAARRG